MLDRLKIFIKHNSFFCVGLLCSLSVLLWTYGCESKVTSLNGTGRLVTREELQCEYENLKARLFNELESIKREAELRVSQLNKQDQFKERLFEELFIVAQSGAISPYGVVSAIAGLLGIGAVVDNRRKTKELTDLKSKSESNNSK